MGKASVTPFSNYKKSHMVLDMKSKPDMIPHFLIPPEFKNKIPQELKKNVTTELQKYLSAEEKNSYSLYQIVFGKKIDESGNKKIKLMKFRNKSHIIEILFYDITSKIYSIVWKSKLTGKLDRQDNPAKIKFTEDGGVLSEWYSEGVLTPETEAFDLTALSSALPYHYRTMSRKTIKKNKNKKVKSDALRRLKKLLTKFDALLN